MSMRELKDKPTSPQAVRQPERTVDLPDEGAAAEPVGGPAATAVAVAPTGVVVCRDEAELERNAWLVAKRLEADGYCVLQGWGSDGAVLRAVTSQFGHPQANLAANGEGVIEESPTSVSAGEAAAAGLATSRTPPATEGCHLHGFLRARGRLRRIGPPPLLAMQCAAPPASGASVVLVDGERILRDLVLNEPWHARILLRPGCVTYCRDEQMAMDFAVFERVGEGRYRTRFAYDSSLYVQHWSEMSVDHLRAHYLGNPAYLLPLRLDRGQILLFDNYRLLHARGDLMVGPDADKWLLRKMWVDGGDNTIFANAVQEKRRIRAFQVFEPYKVLANGRPPRYPASNLRPGIRVGPEVLSALEQLREADEFLG